MREIDVELVKSLELRVKQEVEDRTAGARLGLGAAVCVGSRLRGGYVQYVCTVLLFSRLLPVSTPLHKTNAVI
jgi:hypothetical protein